MRRQASHYTWDHERPTAESSEWPSTTSATLLGDDAPPAAVIRPSRRRSRSSIGKLMPPFALFMLLGGVGVQALAWLLQS